MDDTYLLDRKSTNVMSYQHTSFQYKAEKLLDKSKPKTSYRFITKTTDAFCLSKNDIQF